MKSKIKRYSMHLLAVALTLCLLASCITGGCITAGAATTKTEPVGRGGGYILMGQYDNPHMWTDSGAAVTVSDNIYTATIPKRKFTQTGMNYFIAISSSTDPGDMFFQNDSITVTATGAWFSGSGSQSRDQYRFARISFSVVPTSDIRLQVNTGNNSYTFSYTADETTYGVAVLARTGGQVVTNGVTVNGGNADTVAVGTSPVTISASAKTGYRFSGWTTTGSVTISGTTNSTATMTATGTGTVTANFNDITATRRIYFDNSKAGWAQPYAYAFDGNDVIYSASWPGTKMTQYKGKVWYVDVSTAATKIIFNSGTNTAQTPNLNIPDGGFSPMPTFYDFTGTAGTGWWRMYQESTSANVKSATLDPNSTSGMYTNIDATFYDYYTTSEYNGNYYSSINANTEGWINGISERYPYTQFDKSLSEYAQKFNVDYPMYFLAGYYDNSYHPGGWYRESFQVNDSNGLGGNHKAVTGLSGTKLENGTIHHYKSGVANENGAPMAMFDEEWLTSRSGYTYNGELATIINTKFPVRKNTITEYPTDTLYLSAPSPYNSNNWYAHFFNNADRSIYQDVPMTNAGGTNFTVTNPDTLAFDRVIFCRMADGNPLDWNSNVWNHTEDLYCPNGTNANVKYVINGWGSGNLMNGSWGSQTGVTQRSYNYYEFDSTGGKDNIWFDDCTSAAPTLYYGAGTANAKRSGYNSTYSFLPFDNNATGRAGYGKDYGFGMKLEINFTLGRDENGVETGQVDGADQKFNFSGDDDLWVYVDDQLILDLGGDHAATTGSINFHTKSVSTSPAPYTSLNSATRNTNFTLDTKEVHKMTIFYTERGMHESNLKFGFSVTPIDTDLTVNNVVSPGNINTGLREDALTVAANDSFTVNHYYGTTRAAAEAKTANIGSVVTYTLTDKAGMQTMKTTNMGGTYPLKDGETARFTNTLHKADYLNKYFNLEESFAGNNVYNYTPGFMVRDREIGYVPPSFEEAVDGKSGSFLFNNRMESAVVGDMTPVYLDATFTNSIKTHTLILRKNVLDNLGNDTDTFKIKVAVDIDGAKNAFNYKTYALNYFGDVTGTTAATGTNAGIVTLENEQFAIIPGIPENARVRITEESMDDAYAFDSMDVTGGTKGGDVANGVWLTMSSDVEVDINNSSGGFLTITHDLYPAVEQEEPSAAKCAVSAKVKDGAATVAVFDETQDLLVIGPEYINPDSNNTIEITLRTYDVDTANGRCFTAFWENITGTMRALAAQGLLATVDAVTTDPATQETTVVITTGTVSNLFNADKEQTTDWLPFYSELQPREDWTCTIHYHYPVERNTWTAEDDCLWDEQIETVTCDIDDDFMDDFVKGSINDKVDFYLPNEVFEAYRDDKYTIDILLQVLAPQEEPPAEITWNLSKIIEDGVTVYQYHPPLSVKPVTIFNDAQNKAVEIDVYGNLPAGFHLPVGDVNLDGSVNVRDVTAIQRYLADLAEIPDELRILADTDGNGIVNITDATWLQLYLAEFVDTLGKQQ